MEVEFFLFRPEKLHVPLGFGAIEGAFHITCKVVPPYTPKPLVPPPQSSINVLLTSSIRVRTALPPVAESKSLQTGSRYNSPVGIRGSSPKLGSWQEEISSQSSITLIPLNVNGRFGLGLGPINSNQHTLPFALDLASVTCE